MSSTKNKVKKITMFFFMIGVLVSEIGMLQLIY
jgi:hypothetical protein